MTPHKRDTRKFVIVCVAGMVVSCFLWRLLTKEPGIAPLPAEQILLTKSLDGIDYCVVQDGRVFRIDATNGKWYFHQQAFDAQAMADAYCIAPISPPETEANPKNLTALLAADPHTVRRVNPETGEQYPVWRSFNENFEELTPGLTGLKELCGPSRGWGALTLQSPAAQEISDYVQLRGKLLDGTGTFRDARLHADTRHAHNGSTSLYCEVPAPSSRMVTSKASIASPLVYFRQGDAFWFRGWYRAEQALPTGLMDLECEWLDQHGGIRLLLNERGELLAELKALHKPVFTQPEKTATPFPLDQWVQVQAHFELAADESGVVQVWQDGKLIIDQRGQTLPLANLIYSSLEVGITAHSYGDQPAQLWLDDITVSDRAF